MTPRIFAAALVAILFVGAIETPAHSQTASINHSTKF